VIFFIKLKAEKNFRGVTILLFHILHSYYLKKLHVLDPAGYAKEVHPITCHEDTQGEDRYSSTLSLTSSPEWGGWSTQRSDHFTPRKRIWMSLWNSSVGLGTRYGLHGPGIESCWGQNFPHPSIPDLGPTRPPVQGGIGSLSRGL